MPVLHYSGQTVKVDDEGYLEDFEAWNDTVANALADNLGLAPLTYDQLDILMFMRQYFRKHGFFPVIRSVCKNVHQPDDCVEEEFIDPLVAWKIAGLPRPADEVLTFLGAG